MQALKIVLLIIILVLFQGCAKNNVSFIKHINNPEIVDSSGEGSTVVDVFLDRNGDIYPRKIEGRCFYTQSIESGTPLALAEMDAENCLQNNDDITRVLWLKVQEQRWLSKEKELTEHIKQGSMVVMLIHGFNVDDAYKDYEKIRTKVGESKDKPKHIVFVNIHWDGLKSALPFGIWGGAQFNGPLAGLQLRKLFRKLCGGEDDVPVRIITHSSGAIVAASLVGDASEALPAAKDAFKGEGEPQYEHYIANIGGNKAFPLPMCKNFIIGMIVPATPASSFVGTKLTPSSENEKPTCKDKKCFCAEGVLAEHVKFIVGANKNDFAVSKGPFLGQASIAGSTALAVNKAKVDMLINKLGASRVKYLDFKVDGCNHEFLFWEKHDLACYLQREKQKEFFKALLKMNAESSFLTP